MASLKTYLNNVSVRLRFRQAQPDRSLYHFERIEKLPKPYQAMVSLLFSLRHAQVDMVSKRCLNNY